MIRQLVAGIAAAAFCGAPAIAADMPTKGPVYKADPAPTGYDWTGFYVGGNAGYGWGDSSYSFSADNGAGQGLLNTGIAGGITPQSGSFRTTGFIGGGQLGYNRQFDRTWVTGIEADIAFSDIRGSGSPAATANLGIGGIQPVSIPAERKLDWFGTVRARLGMLPTDRLLVFATAGLAFGRTSANASIAVPVTGAVLAVPPDGTTLSCVGLLPCVAGAGSRTSAGWALGGGLEYAVWNNVSVKAEYLYVNLGSQMIHLTAVPPATGTGSVATSFNDAAYHIVRVGLNYKFGSQ
jgi:outer membrane immunogenic protein